MYANRVTDLFAYTLFRIIRVLHSLCTMTCSKLTYSMTFIMHHDLLKFTHLFGSECLPDQYKTYMLFYIDAVRCSHINSLIYFPTTVVEAPRGAHKTVHALLSAPCRVIKRRDHKFTATDLFLDNRCEWAMQRNSSCHGNASADEAANESHCRKLRDSGLRHLFCLVECRSRASSADS